MAVIFTFLPLSIECLANRGDHVSSLAQGCDEIAILARMTEHMDDFKHLIDAAPRDGLDLLLTRFPGLFLYAKLIEYFAEGIAAGNVAVPPAN